MKKTARILSIALLFVLVFSFTACGNKTETSEQAPAGGTFTRSDLYGTWIGIDGEISTLTFANDGSFSDIAGSDLYIMGTYTVDEANSTITVFEKDYGMTFVYAADLTDNKLTIQVSGGKPRTFAKKQ